MRWAVALLCLAGALVAPASAAAFPDSVFENQCQYSYDRYWRPVPIVFGGRLTNGSGVELTPGAQLSVGDTVRLEGGTVSAVLPSWITTFAYEAGMIPLGDGQLPVKAWLSLEATNTAEGIKAGIPLDTVARTHVVLTPGGVVDEERSSVIVEEAPVPTQSWTATGGELLVRQAFAESLPPLPIREDGSTARVRGSLFVDAKLTFPSGELFHLYLDCLQGEQVRQGETHTDAIPGTVGAFSVPGFTGAVDAAPVTDPVDVDLQISAGPPRAAQGTSATLTSSSLRLRLTDAQRDAWFGNATSVAFSGTVGLTGDRSSEVTQEVDVDQVVAVAADGPVTVTLRLPDTTWSATTGDGIDIRGSATVTLDATAGGVTKTLTLTRISAGDPYPFARILRPGANPTPIVRPPVVTPTPTPTAVPVPAPSPTPTPAAAPKVTVRSTKLKVSANRVSTSLKCTGTAACRGTVTLRTTAKVKKRYVTLTKAVKYTVAAGKTATVRLSLSSAGKKHLRGKKRVAVALDVKPASGKTVTKKLTLTR
ncbi:hypothetical protein OJ997_18540 [Solirubrobacter phytolaccae]|uniref:Htaa domain-containing protein n=1 Tax=Solirubrobacter phytolaccae TaxID=1404360 RepID=A0A9X3SGC7_9ACTN|nr:hypothetical protein [Solirubrobacter phytolaccae]MDA0182312.1 hypothetical protein [Solirubrobacter phytolaccae]